MVPVPLTLGTLPGDAVKVLLGDNLAAHLSPYVLAMCERHNVRFVFLPENSTHLLQPLDRSIFGPLKQHWRKVLTNWKIECTREGREYATIPKEIFPMLVGKLLERDFSSAIISGFAATGVHPFSMERALSKLPAENRDVDSAFQHQLLDHLKETRYGGGDKQARASRPKKNQKLPPGSSYTCLGNSGQIAPPVNPADELVEEELLTVQQRIVAIKNTQARQVDDEGEDSDSSCYSSISAQVEEIMRAKNTNWQGYWSKYFFIWPSYCTSTSTSTRVLEFWF